MCTRPFSRNMWLSYIYCFLCATIRPRLRVLIHLIFLYAHNHLIKICGRLPFIIPFEHDHSNKVIRVLIYIFISFIHDHSTKIRGHLLFNLFTNKLCQCFVHYIHGSTYIPFIVFMVALLLYFVCYVHVYMKSTPYETERYSGNSGRRTEFSKQS